MDWLYDMGKTITFLLLGSGLVEQLIGEEDSKKYVRFLIGLFVCTVFLQYIATIGNQKICIDNEGDFVREQSYMEEQFFQWEEKRDKKIQESYREQEGSRAADEKKENIEITEIQIGERE